MYLVPVSTGLKDIQLSMSHLACDWFCDEGSDMVKSTCLFICVASSKRVCKQDPIPPSLTSPWGMWIGILGIC